MRLRVATDEEESVFRESVADIDRRLFVDRLLCCCDRRQVYILQKRFGLTGHPHTLQEVGDLLGLTRETIRAIQAKAMRRIRRDHWRFGVRWCDL